MTSNVLACVIPGLAPVASCCALDGDAGQSTHLLVASGHALLLWGSVEGASTQLRSWPLPGQALHVELIRATEAGGGSWCAAPVGEGASSAAAAADNKCQRSLILVVIQGADARELLLLRARGTELEVVDRAPLAAEDMPHVELAAPRFSALCTGHPPAHRTVGSAGHLPTRIHMQLVSMPSPIITHHPLSPCHAMQAMVCAAVESCLHVVSVNHTRGHYPSLEVSASGVE